MMGDVQVTKSQALFEEGIRNISGGPPVTHHLKFEDHVYFERAEGAYLYDVDGNRWTDLQGGFSALPMGHNVPVVREAIRDYLDNAYFLPASHRPIVELSTVIRERVPSIEKLQFADSATRATHFAVRAARQYTGRPKFAKFIGSYHGSWDAAMYGTAVRYGADPDQMYLLPGMPRHSGGEVVLLPYNEQAECERIIADHADELGSLIVEPVQGDGYIPPLPGFLPFLREICDQHGIVLIFDETITLALAPGGAQELYGVWPDLTTMGKAMSGGLPIAATGGRAEIMAVGDGSKVDLPVHPGGSLAGHVLGAVASRAQLQAMTPDVYARLHELGDRARDGINAIGERLGLPELYATGVGHLLNLHVNSRPSVTYADHLGCDISRINEFDYAFYRNRYLPIALGRIHLNSAMSDEDVDGFLEVVATTAEQITAKA